MELTKGKVNEKRNKKVFEETFMNGENVIKLKIRKVIGYKENI